MSSGADAAITPGQKRNLQTEGQAVTIFGGSRSALATSTQLVRAIASVQVMWGNLVAFGPEVTCRRKLTVWIREKHAA